MLSRLINLVLVVPLAALIVVFAVANRGPVTLGFDPFSPAAPAVSVTVPLFVLMFACVMIGVVAGGVAVWAKQGRFRRRARDADDELRRMRREAEDLRGRLAPQAASHSALPALGPGSAVRR